MKRRRPSLAFVGAACCFAFGCAHVAPDAHVRRVSEMMSLDEKTGRLRAVATLDELAAAEKALRGVHDPGVDGKFLPAGSERLGENHEDMVLFDGFAFERLADDGVGQPRWHVMAAHVYVGEELLPRPHTIVVTSPTLEDGGVALSVGGHYRMVAVHVLGRFYVWRMGVLALQPPWQPPPTWQQ